MVDIEYKTEGSVILRPEALGANAVAVLWLKGDDHIKLRSGSSDVRLDKAQLLALLRVAPQLMGDITPQTEQVVEVLFG